MPELVEGWSIKGHQPQHNTQGFDGAQPPEKKNALPELVEGWNSIAQPPENENEVPEPVEGPQGGDNRFKKLPSNYEIQKISKKSPLFNKP